MSKLVKTGTTLVDLLIVAKAIPEDEKQQLLAFGGNPNPEAIAVGVYNNATFMWTGRLDTTGEPLVVGGYTQVGPTIFRSFFLANPRVWAEYGKEVTALTIEAIEEIKESLGFCRLETYCLPERELARKWYERIGLAFDAELKGFGVNGESAVLYSTVAIKSKIELATVSDLNNLSKRQVN